MEEENFSNLTSHSIPIQKIVIILDNVSFHKKEEYIANQLFKSLEELELLLHRLLNEGELVVKWGGKIKNKGNSISTV